MNTIGKQIQRNQGTMSSTGPFFSRPSSARSTQFFPTSRLSPTPYIQAKLTVGAPKDRFEQEADSVADRVLQRMEVGPEEEAETPAIQTKCATCEREDAIRRQPAETELEEAGTGDAILQMQQATSRSPELGAAQAARAVAGGGRPFSSAQRAAFEPHFGRDFSGVRIHDGAAPSAAAKAIQARAYTLGNNIAFAPGEFSPGTRSGRHLIAHELTHVLQQ